MTTLLVILQILLFQTQKLTVSYLAKDLMAPLLLNYKTKKHYLAFETQLFVLVYFLKFILYSHLVPFKISQVK